MSPRRCSCLRGSEGHGGHHAVAVRALLLCLELQGCCRKHRGSRGSSTCGVCVRGTGRVPRAYPHAMRCGAYVGSREPPSASCSTRSRVGGVCTGFLQRSLESCPGCLIAGLTNRGQKFFLRGGKATNLPELHTTTFCQRASTCCLLSRWEVYVWPTYFSSEPPQLSKRPNTTPCGHDRA